MAKKDFSTRITEADTTGGSAVALGRAVLDGEVLPDVAVTLPAAMLNRHGLIAGGASSACSRSVE